LTNLAPRRDPHGVETWMAASTLLKRIPRLAEVGNTAALMAFDYVSPITAGVPVSSR